MEKSKPENRPTTQKYPRCCTDYLKHSVVGVAQSQERGAKHSPSGSEVKIQLKVGQVSKVSGEVGIVKTRDRA